MSKITLREKALIEAKGYDKGFSRGIAFGGIAMTLSWLTVWVIAHGQFPSALDVYRGKTTLEITYRDSVAVDSTVVYKVK